MSRTRSSFLFNLTASGAFRLVLLAAPSYAQTIQSADARPSVHESIRPFKIDVSRRGTRPQIRAIKGTPNRATTLNAANPNPRKA